LHLIKKYVGWKYNKLSANRVEHDRQRKDGRAVYPKTL
jgi:hypothetical protein